MFSDATTPCATCGQQSEHCDTYKNCDDCTVKMLKLLEDWEAYELSGWQFFPTGYKHDLRMCRDEILKGVRAEKRRRRAKRKGKLRDEIIQKGLGKVVHENIQTKTTLGIRAIPFNEQVLACKRLDHQLIKEILREFYPNKSKS